MTIKIEISGIPKDDKLGDIQEAVDNLLHLFKSYKFNWEEAKSL